MTHCGKGRIRTLSGSSTSEEEGQKPQSSRFRKESNSDFLGPSPKKFHYTTSEEEDLPQCPKQIKKDNENIMIGSPVKTVHQEHHDTTSEEEEEDPRFRWAGARDRLVPATKKSLLHYHDRTSEEEQASADGLHDYSQQASSSVSSCSDEEYPLPLTNFFGSGQDHAFSMDGKMKNQELEVSKQGETVPSGNSAAVCSIGEKLMKEMGYKEGKGLGKFSQGRVMPVEASKQRGRRGLGFAPKGLEAGTVEWDFSQEVVEIEEMVRWMPEHNLPALSFAELKTWMSKGPKKLTIEDETNYCSIEMLKRVLSCKSVFDELEPEELRHARTRSNPFETIRGCFFQNRAAMKMANMDAVFDFMFTDPRDENNVPLVPSGDLLYFADVCAGPGGFSEYVLWRKGWEAKGFGFTLRGQNDFKLAEFYAGSCESFEPHYGVNGIEGDGDVFKPDNIQEFEKFVLQNTEERGVHFMMADGGFSVEGSENIQEILSKQLYLCQFLVALGIVRIGGHFVCKLFDIFTPFSVGLVYLMYRSFKNVCIHKPNTSRPANSERYIICKWKRDDTKDIYDYMFDVNLHLEQLGSVTSDDDIVEVVPITLIKDDKEFFNYMYESNESLGERQVVNLAKIAAFTRDTELYEKRQAEVKKKCLSFWKIPDKARVAPVKVPPHRKFEELLKGSTTSFMSETEKVLTPDTLHSSVKSLFDWNCVVIASPKGKSERGFYLGLGRSNIFHWDGGKWNKMWELKFELSSDTLFFGEIVQELRGKGMSQRKTSVMYIIDALFLGGKDVTSLHLKERHKLCKKFAKAMSKTSRPDFLPLRVKELFRMEDLGKIFDRLAMQVVKGSGGKPRLVYQEEEKFFLPSGILFFKTVEDPWMMALSRSMHKKYWFNTRTKQSVFDCPRESIAGFISTFKKRICWWWDDGVQVHHSQRAAPDKVHKDTVLNVISMLFPR